MVTNDVTNLAYTSTSLAPPIDERPVSETMLVKAADFDKDGRLDLVIIDSGIDGPAAFTAARSCGCPAKNPLQNRGLQTVVEIEC